MSASHHSRLMVVAAAFLVPLCVAAAVHAGGNPGKLIAVGANHVSRAVELSPADGELLYKGKITPRPNTGYIRIYPIFFGLPGATARLYPAGDVLCFEPPPKAPCRTLPSGVRETLASLAGLPLRVLPPNTVDTLLVGARPIHLPNVRTAVELAFDRGGHRSSAVGSLVIRIVWRGPDKAAMPRSARIGSSGIYASGRLYPLSASVTSYLRRNLHR